MKNKSNREKSMKQGNEWFFEKSKRGKKYLAKLTQKKVRKQTLPILALKQGDCYRTCRYQKDNNGTVGKI